MNSTTTHIDPVRRRSTTRRVVAGAMVAVVSLAGVGFVAGPAGASESTEARDHPTLDQAKARCIQAIDRRIQALGELTSRIDGDRYLTDSHRSTLNGIVSHALEGMQSLKPQVQADTDAASLKAHCTSVVEDYRVFVLVHPQVHITRIADAGAAAVTKLQAVEAKVAPVIAEAKAAGKDTTAAEAANATFVAAVDKLSGDVTGLADPVLSLTPADYNANHGVLDAARATAQTSRTDAKAVREAGKALRESLKALRG